MTDELTCGQMAMAIWKMSQPQAEGLLLLLGLFLIDKRVVGLLLIIFVLVYSCTGVPSS